MVREMISLTKKTTKLCVTNNKITAILRAEDQKTGLRLYQDGRIGVASALGRYDGKKLRADAEQMLRFQIPYEAAPTEGAVRQVDLSGRCKLSDDEFIRISEALLGALESRYPAFAFGNVIRLVETEINLQNDAGTDLSHRDKSVTMELIIKYRASKNLLDALAVDQFRTYDFDTALAAASELCRPHENPVALPSEGKWPVVVLAGSEEGEALCKKFLTDLDGRQYGTGASLFAGRAGEVLFSPRFTLEVGRRPEEDYACFFDGEGTTLGGDCCALVEDGLLKSPFAAKKTARRYGLPLTGSAALQYDAAPDTEASHIRPKPGDKTLGELLGGRRAVYVAIASGGDFTPQGEFATPVQAAYLFDGETLFGRLPQLALSSHVYDMFGRDFIGVSRDGPSPESPLKYMAMEMDVKQIGGHM